MPGTPAAVPHPGGTITFLDGTTVLNPGGTPLTANPAVSSQSFAQVFGTPDPGLAAVAQGAVMGDFNGDGNSDLMIYGGKTATSLELQIFLGSSEGPGHFQTLAPQTLTFSSSSLLGYATPAVLDVDGDGKLDLLIGNTVASGKGDGTFSSAVVLPMLATGFNQTYAVDVNGDGKLDIVAVNTPPPVDILPPFTVQLMFTVFRNDGSGTFTSLGSFPLGAPIIVGLNVGCCSGYNIFGLSFADLNGDGKMDVISQSNAVPTGNGGTVNNLNVMLNNGDGTFGAVKPIDVTALKNLYGAGVAFGDINGDGKQDLILAFASNAGANFLGAALGTGDGTFGAFSQLQLINFLTEGIGNPQVQVMDFNGDGKLDAVLGSGEVALGNGDGTFSLSTPLFPQPADPQTPLNYALLQASLFPNSLPSLVYLNLASGANAVFTPQDSSGATVNAALGVGTHTLTAQYSGDSTYAASTSSPVTITVAPAAAPTITVTSSANPIYATQSVTFTATLSDPTITGSITFVDTSKNDDNPLDPMAGSTESTLGAGTIANGVATLTTKLLVGGTHTVLAVYGSNIYAPIAQAQLTETVNVPFAINVSTTGISLTASPGQTVTATLPIQGLGGFTGQVTLGCGNGDPICSISPATVNITGTGTTNVTMTVTAAVASAPNTVALRLRGVALACGIPLFALLGFSGGRRRRILLLAFAVAMCLVTFTGCGGGGSNGSSTSTALKPGVYPFNITATSGQNTQVAQGMLTVQ